MDEPVAKLGRIALAHIDEITEHIVVFNLEAWNIGFVAVAGFHIGDQASAFVAQADELVERRTIALGDKAAVADVKRRRRFQRLGEARG